MPEGNRPSSPPRRLSNPSNPNLKAVSAARRQPLKTADAGGPLSARLKSGAEDTALNAFGLLRDTWDDFRRADRFFKYKAFVIAAWLGLSGASFVIACPGSGGPHNTLDAKLVLSRVLDSPVVMITNQSGKAWTDVVVTVNKQYRAKLDKVAVDADFTLEPKKLLTAEGQPAPNSIVIRDVQVKSRQGSADLLEDGQPP